MYSFEKNTFLVTRESWRYNDFIKIFKTRKKLSILNNKLISSISEYDRNKKKLKLLHNF